VEGLEVLEDVALAPLTTLGVGGPARYYVCATSRGQVAGAARWAASRGLALFVLGGGSNVVVADEGFPGLVLHVALAGVETRLRDGAAEVTAAAGEDWDALVARTVAEGWAGFECLSGIPGLAGATPIQNVGAYGQEIAETVTVVEALEPGTGRLRRFENAECGFGYRHSRFKGVDRGRYVVLAVSYRLSPGGAPAIRYPELERYLAETGRVRPTLGEVRDAVLAVRRRKAMVLDPADPNTRSVGSFFVNPVVAAERLAEIADSERRRTPTPDGVPSFPVAGGVKVPAAWLIERAGFTRGLRRGGVGISDRHTLAIVNRGGATARDVLALAREIQDAVNERFGILLEPEPVLVGAEPETGPALTP
jgi:UDP-N-acetylmuramate dehydrogenase